MPQPVQTQDRRRSIRVAAAYPVSLCDDTWRILARGRTANISETGVSVVADARRGVPETGQVHVEITLPAEGKFVPGRRQMRIARYVCRIARVQQLGNLMGLGLDFTEKLD
jgi:c-di-GMP-binding flagellar brake protein YcgR